MQDHHHQQQQQLPSGFRFLPGDIDLVDYYLRNRIVHGLQPNKCLIQELDVYQQEPWHLPCDSFPYGKTTENEMYFITPRHLISSGSSRSRRVNRTCGAGLWDGHARDKPIKKGPNGEVIGHKNQLAFKLRSGKIKIETGWIMHEFRLNPPPNLDGKYDKIFDELVLCKIHKKEGSKHPAPADQEMAERASKRQRTEKYGDQEIGNVSNGLLSWSHFPQMVSWEGAGNFAETLSTSGDHCADGLLYDDGFDNMTLLQHISMPPSSDADYGTPSTSGDHCSDGLFCDGGFGSMPLLQHISMPTSLDADSGTPSTSGDHCSGGFIYDDGFGNMPSLQYISMPPSSDADFGTLSTFGDHCYDGLLYDGGFGNMPSLQDISMPPSSQMPPQTDSDCFAKDVTELSVSEDNQVGNLIQELCNDGFDSMPSMEDVLTPPSSDIPPSTEGPAGVSLQHENAIHEFVYGEDIFFFDVNDIRSLLQFGDEPTDTQPV